MYFKNLLPSLFMFLAATVSSAAEPEAKPQTAAPDQAAATISAESAEPVIPKQELKFDASEEEVPLPLEGVGMLDQRYVATFKLILPKIDMSESPDGGSTRVWTSAGISPIRSYKNLERNLGGWDQILLEHLMIFESFGQFLLNRPNQMASFSVVSNYFYQYNANRPNENRLSNDIINSIMWKNPPFIKIENHIGTITGVNANRVEVQLLAPTDKHARQWVEKWLSIYDDGLCYRAQKECLNLRKKLVETLAENSDKLKNAEAELSNAKQVVQKYKEFEDIKPEAIVTLTTQRRMLAVDLAGINARIKACQEMLAKGNLPDARKDQIETARVAAEIELRGLDAKQTEIDRIIQGAQNRQKFTSEINYLPGNIGRLKNTIDNIQKAIPELEQYQLGYQPLPVEDGKVTIRRIKWISPPKTEKSKSDSPSK